MATDKLRIQVYVEPELYQKLIEWKKEQGISHVSEALNQILVEKFGAPSQSLSNLQSLTKEEINEIIGNSLKSFGQVLDGRLDAFQSEIDSLKQRQEQLNSDLENIQLLKLRLDAVEEIIKPIEGLAELSKPMGESELPSKLNLTQLARRLNVAKSVISNRKNRPDFQGWSSSKDPDGLAWQCRKEGQWIKFYPVGVGDNS